MALKGTWPLAAVSVTATAALTAHRFIGFDGAHCGANKKAHGVTEMAWDSGEQASVVIAGVVKVQSGGSFAVGDAIVSDANGKAIKATNVSVTGTATLANAVVPAGATPVTSDAAQPTLTMTQPTIANAVAGGALPQVILGYAVDAAGAADEFPRIQLV